MPKWTGLKAPRKFAAPGWRGSPPSIAISKSASLGAQPPQDVRKAICSWGPRSKGADKGILRSACFEQTMNENCKLVKKDLIGIPRLSGQPGGRQ
jgi:hypothetical protein